MHLSSNNAKNTNMAGSRRVRNRKKQCDKVKSAD